MRARRGQEMGPCTGSEQNWTDLAVKRKPGWLFDNTGVAAGRAGCLFLFVALCSEELGSFNEEV